MMMQLHGKFPRKYIRKLRGVFDIYKMMSGNKSMIDRARCEGGAWLERLMEDFQVVLNIVASVPYFVVKCLWGQVSGLDLSQPSQ